MLILPLNRTIYRGGGSSRLVVRREPGAKRTKAVFPRHRGLEPLLPQAGVHHGLCPTHKAIGATIHESYALSHQSLRSMRNGRQFLTRGIVLHLGDVKMIRRLFNEIGRWMNYLQS